MVPVKLETEPLEGLSGPDKVQNVPQEALPLGKIPDTGKQEKASKLKGMAFLAYLGLLLFGTFITLLVILTFLTLSWSWLFYDVQSYMPKTYGWEKITQILGSSYDDCIDHSRPVPVPLLPPDRCTYNVTLAWIPLMGGITTLAALIALLLAVANLHWQKPKSSLFWIQILIILCIVETYRFTVSVCILLNAKLDRNSLGNLMHATMGKSTEMLSKTYFRWNITQTQGKCCGVDKGEDWKFAIFRFGDPRFPMSCCNTEKYICKYFPDRRAIWKEGCLDKQVDLIQSYRNWHLFLLVLSYCTIVMTTLTVSQFYMFIHRTQPNFGGNEIKVKLFGKEFTFNVRTEAANGVARSSYLGHVTSEAGRPTIKYESGGITSLAINKLGIFLSTKRTNTTLTVEKPKETVV